MTNNHPPEKFSGVSYREQGLNRIAKTEQIAGNFRTCIISPTATFRRSSEFVYIFIDRPILPTVQARDTALRLVCNQHKLSLLSFIVRQQHKNLAKIYAVLGRAEPTFGGLRGLPCRRPSARWAEPVLYPFGGNSDSGLPGERKNHTSYSIGSRQSSSSVGTLIALLGVRH
jgi:hypothetical protein